MDPFGSIGISGVVLFRKAGHSMTTGMTIEGTYGAGHHRKRQWAGTDGLHGDEHSYSYNLNVSFLAAVRYKRFDQSALYWKNSSMNTFCPSLPKSSLPILSELVNCANTKIWGDLAQSKFNAGVFAGEFRESYGMLCNFVRSISLAIRYWKRGKIDKALQILVTARKKPSITGTAANTYMLVHFGFIPLFHDMEALYELMKTKYKVVKRVRRHCVHKDTNTYTMNTVTWRWNLKAIVEIRGDVEMVELSEMDRMSCFDLSTVAWELTRLSWMIDWVAPIGNFLSAVNASNKTQGARFAMTKMQEESLDSPVNGSVYQIEPWYSDSYRVLKPSGLNLRDTNIPLPWTFPTISNPLGDNLSRWVTSIAFLRQSVGR